MARRPSSRQAGRGACGGQHGGRCLFQQHVHRLLTHWASSAGPYGSVAHRQPSIDRPCSAFWPLPGPSAATETGCRLSASAGQASAPHLPPAWWPALRLALWGAASALISYTATNVAYSERCGTSVYPALLAVPCRRWLAAGVPTGSTALIYMGVELWDGRPFSEAHRVQPFHCSRLSAQPPRPCHRVLSCIRHPRPARRWRCPQCLRRPSAPTSSRRCTPTWPRTTARRTP